MTIGYMGLDAVGTPMALHLVKIGQSVGVDGEARSRTRVIRFEQGT